MNLKIKFLPYEKFKESGSKSLLRELKGNTLILIDAKLTAEEEAELIKDTMKRVSDNFSGIELSSIELFKPNGLGRIKAAFLEFLLRKKRGLTIIGPARIVRRIEKNPEELLVYM